MVLHAEQRFDKVLLDREHPEDFIAYISHAMERELVNNFIVQLEDHKLHVVALKEPEFIENPPGSWQNQSAYRQTLVCFTFVQCKDCCMAYPWCHRFRDELGGEGYCPYGKEIPNE